MAEDHPSSWHLKGGGYLGEISALAFVHLPSHFSHSRLPLLVAGTGSQVLVYDVASADVLASFHAFEGIRVHGIVSRCSGDGGECFQMTSIRFDTRIVIFGEKKVKLFWLVVAENLERLGQSAPIVVRFELDCSLPTFDHWVLDAIFLKEGHYLVLGLGDNSVAIWDITSSNLILRVHSPERCLLYSMRLWGSNLRTLRIASGTIYNEIIVWKLVASESSPMNGSCNFCKSGSSRLQLCGQYKAVHLNRLIGHEGSIFRISWTTDGSKLISVSDDRSARIWTMCSTNQDFFDQKEFTSSPVCFTLYGHDARIWDGCISDSIVITVGEDCTCRIWGMDGNLLVVIKEHIGRGIWRCLYDPASALLFTAGFDSAIKAHQLHFSSLNKEAGQNGVVNDLMDRTETFTTCCPTTTDQHGLMDSKSEYIRCLSFARENVFYVATNNGFLYHVIFCNRGDVKWTKLTSCCEEVPVISMDLISSQSSVDPVGSEDIIGIGDGKGKVTVIKVLSSACDPKVVLSFTWSAEAERQLLGVYWCKSFGHNHLFTSDPRGALNLWSILDTSWSNDSNTEIGTAALCVASFLSSFRTRITCLDTSSAAELLVCGDHRGNISIFPFQKKLWSIGTSMKITPLSHFKGAHGISSVASVSLRNISSNITDICTTGGDGCICYLKFNNNSKEVNFIGMKKLKALSIIKSVITTSRFDEDLACGTYAVGFTSTDFIVYNLMNEYKVSHVTCGGWRRPYSFYFGDDPETQNCFAFLKDHTIHIHRLWVPSDERQCSFTKVIHIPFHGREIHTLCFVSFGFQTKAVKGNDIWVATGCENGTVRLTRYNHSTEDSWLDSRILGEHVAGSSVRSLISISRTHTLRSLCPASPDVNNDHFLLISVGAKQVLTAWILRNNSVNEEHAYNSIESESNTSSRFSSLSFQWLSNYMPSKHASAPKRMENIVRTTANDISASKSSLLSALCPSENSTDHSKFTLCDTNENDWRYLAVTAFLVKASECRFSVCFIVVSSSDASLTLHALIIPHGLWFDVALLVPQVSPILTLQHIVHPFRENCKCDCQSGNAYIIISGSTNGTIAFWDITDTVKNFMQSMLEFQPENYADYQKRPQTGRGSQGGRSWKSSSGLSSNMGTTFPSNESDSQIRHCSSNADKTGSATAISPEMELSTSTRFISKSRTKKKLLSVEIRELLPVYVIESAHQSGVNCLYVSQMNYCKDLTSAIAYCVLSGGDDQSIHSLVFVLKQHSDDQSKINISYTPSKIQGETTKFGFIQKCCHSTCYSLNILHRSTTASAHSSAVKGIWTDGVCAFSTGLDQRVRCWHIDSCGKPTEHGHMIISVPEPEALDAIIFERNQYQIAVAGRGMQMVKYDVIRSSDKWPS